jgi:hypothetical protein
VLNFGLRLWRCGFQTYVHPVDRIVAAAERHGFTLEVRERHGLLWESSALVR